MCVVCPKKAAFDSIIEQYGKRIYNYCFGMLRSQYDAQDAVQEIFFKAYQNFNKLENPDALQSWLYRIASNHCTTQLRKKKLIQYISLSDSLVCKDQPFDELLNNEYSKELSRVLNKLTVYERNVLTLRVLGGFDYSEIGLILKKQPAALRKQYERVKVKVEKGLISTKGGYSDEELNII